MDPSLLANQFFDKNVQYPKIERNSPSLIYLLFSLEKSNECKFWYLQGNGFCDDSANTLDCNFDGGDCCGTIRKGQCEECACKQESQGNFGQKIAYNVRISV